MPSSPILLHVSVTTCHAYHKAHKQPEKKKKITKLMLIPIPRQGGRWTRPLGNVGWAVVGLVGCGPTKAARVEGAKRGRAQAKAGSGHSSAPLIHSQEAACRAVVKKSGHLGSWGVRRRLHTPTRHTHTHSQQQRSVRATREGSI